MVLFIIQVFPRRIKFKLPPRKKKTTTKNKKKKKKKKSQKS